MADAKRKAAVSVVSGRGNDASPVSAPSGAGRWTPAAIPVRGSRNFNRSRVVDRG